MFDPTTCTAILADRDRRAPVLVNPGAPQERSSTPCGSLRWEQLPPDPSLAGCREIDIFGAVRTTLHAAADAEGGCKT